MVYHSTLIKTVLHRVIAKVPSGHHRDSINPPPKNDPQMMFGSWGIISPTSTNQGFAYSPAMGKVAAQGNLQPAGWWSGDLKILVPVIPMDSYHWSQLTSPIDPKLPKPYAPKSLLWIRNRWLWGWGLVLLSWLDYAIGLWIPNFQVTQAQHRRCPPVPATGRSCSQTKRQKPEAYDAFFEATLMSPPIVGWLVVWTPLKNISQLGWLFPICGKIKNVPNHQPVGNEDQGKRLKQKKHFKWRLSKEKKGKHVLLWHMGNLGKTLYFKP